MDKILKYIFGVLLIVAIVIIGYLVINRTTPLISIDKRVSYDQQQHQEQYSYQGQLIIQNGFTQGNKLVWKCKPVSNEKPILTEMESILNALPPQYSIPSKQFYHPAVGLANCVGEFMVEIKK